MMKNNIVDELSASYYSFKQIYQSRSYNQYAFVAHIDNQWVARNTVEKSYQEDFENVKSCRFNDFNFI